MYSYVLESPLLPIVATVIALAALTQTIKAGLRKAGIRHHTATEALLPVVPIVLGSVGGALYGAELGLTYFVSTDTIPWTLGALHGAVLGAVSGQAYKLALEWLPEQYAAILRQEIPADEEGH